MLNKARNAVAASVPVRRSQSGIPTTYARSTRFAIVATRAELVRSAAAVARAIFQGYVRFGYGKAAAGRTPSS